MAGSTCREQPLNIYPWICGPTPPLQHDNEHQKQLVAATGQGSGVKGPEHCAAMHNPFADLKERLARKLP